MAIPGISDKATLEKIDGFFMGYIGVLNKGDAKGENRPGREQPYFRFTGYAPGVQEAFAELFGKEPTAVTAHFAGATVEEIFPTSYFVRKGRKIEWECDGSNGPNTPSRVKVGNGYSRRLEDCQKITCSPDDPGAKVTGTLNFIIPGLIEKGHVGLIRMPTTSIFDCLFLSKFIAGLLAECAKTGESIANVIVTLYRKEAKILNPTDGKHYTHWLVEAKPDMGWIMTRLTAPARFQEIEATRQIDENGEVVYEQSQIEATTEPAKLEAVESPEQAQVDENGEVVLPKQETKKTPLPTTGEHWIDKPRVRAGWFAWLKDEDVTKEKACEILGAKSMHDYAGHLGAAKMAIMGWKKAQQLEKVGPDVGDGDNMGMNT